MQRILFLLPSFQLGGTNSSLNGFLSKIDRNRFSIDVFAFDDKGPNRAIVSQYAHIIGGDDSSQSEKKSTSLSLKDVVRYLKRLLFKVHIDISPLAFRKMAKQFSSKGYDFVISFQEGQTTKFLTYFRNTYRIAWIHCDYSNYLNINKFKPEQQIYSKIDKVVCVSRFTRDSFLSALPELGKKTFYLYNVFDVESILNKSKESVDVCFPKEEDVFKLVSIGRLDPVKRFDIIPQIAHGLKKKGFQFCWYIIGDGSEEYKSRINNNIDKLDVKDSVKCIGPKNNPYPYIASSDLVVITSTSEACPMVLNEAKILQIPVVTTDYSSSFEFIDDGKNGLIRSIDEMVEGLSQLMGDKALYQKIKENLSNFKYPNDDIMSKLENEILVK